MENIQSHSDSYREEHRGLSFETIEKHLHDPMLPDKVKDELLGNFFELLDELERGKRCEEYDEEDEISRKKAEYERKSKYLINDDIPRLVHEYERWVNDDFYIVLGKLENGELGSFKCILSPKRGNKAYARNMAMKLRSFQYSLGSQIFFPSSDHHRIHQTPILKITLTYDRKKKTRYDAWGSIGPDTNRFRSRLAKVFGPVSPLRSWEAHKDGYPHINFTVLFKEHKFNVRWMDFRDPSRRKTKGAFRVLGVDTIRKMWPHGFIDVMAISSVEGGLDYDDFKGGDLSKLTLMYDVKYITKDYTSSHHDPKAILQMAILWRLHKRTFSMGISSKKQNREGFIEAYNRVCVGRLDLIGVVNSNFSGLRAEGSWMFITFQTPYDYIYRIVKPRPGVVSFSIPGKIMCPL